MFEGVPLLPAIGVGPERRQLRVVEKLLLLDQCLGDIDPASPTIQISGPRLPMGAVFLMGSSTPGGPVDLLWGEVVVWRAGAVVVFAVAQLGLGELLRGIKHFEAETYAWEVLPEDLQIGELADGIARELAWLRDLAAQRPTA